MTRALRPEIAPESALELELIEIFENGATVPPAAELLAIVDRLDSRLPWTAAQRAARRLRPFKLFEAAIAAALLVILAPVLLAVGLAITAFSRRLPLIRHERVGLGGATLRMLKFRTMWGYAGQEPATKTALDARVTSRFARWCRRHSLDELPQLWHVVRGEMSLVGPRPLTRRELTERYGRSAERVLAVRPGMTGLWQVLGRSRLNYEQRRRLDLLFLDHASPRLYVRILIRTARIVATGENAW